MSYTGFGGLTLKNAVQPPSSSAKSCFFHDDFTPGPLGPVYKDQSSVRQIVRLNWDERKGCGPPDNMGLSTLASEP